MRFCRFILISLVFFSPVNVFALEVRVGIYDNPPLVFQDEAGQPQGLYPDLLRAVAEAEGWSLTYVLGTFSEGLERLRSGEIDLMTAIALRKERTSYADFSRKNVLTMWGELLSRPESDIHSLADIHTKRVAVSRGDINFAAFAELCTQFNFKPEFIVLDDFPTVLKAVADGEAEAGVVSKLFAASQREHYKLVSTGVIFNPFSLHFAAPIGRGLVLLNRLDDHLETWQNSNSSIYFRSLERWLGTDAKAHSSKLPTWLVPLGLVLGTCLLVAIAWGVILRRKVRLATAEIAERERLALAQRDNLQQIVDNIPIGVWLSDAGGALLLENPAGAKIWGRKGLAGLTHYGEMRGWWADSGEQLGIEDWGLARALSRGETCLNERIEIETCNGERKIILASAVPLHDAQGRLIGGLEIEQDITEHRRSEQERLELITLLEERNIELEQFTYTVSHDLKTPLVTIGGFVGQLRKDIESGDRDSAAIDLDFIESSVQIMGGLLANLLHLARAGRALSAPQAFSLEHVMQIALDFAQGDIQDIPVRCEFPEDLPALSGDAERVREALQNLLENAAKFCRDEPHPEIGIGCRLEGEQAVCWVSDNGIGIQPQYHEKIFQLFEKLDASRSGTGIGLSVSRRIVEKHGGRLWVESEGDGKGSTFFMALPLSGYSIAAQI